MLVATPVIKTWVTPRWHRISSRTAPVKASIAEDGERMAKESSYWVSPRVAMQAEILALRRLAAVASTEPALLIENVESIVGKRQPKQLRASFVSEWNVIRMCARGIRIMLDVDPREPLPDRIGDAEAQLRQEREELRRIVDLIPQQIVVLSPEGKAIYANRVSMEYTGLSLEEVRADDFRERVFHPEDIQRLREQRQKALAGTIPFENEQRGLGKDGKYRWFLIRYNPFLGEDGKVIRWYATATDIEDRKQTQEALRNALDQVQQSEARLRQVIDTIPTLVWCDLPDGPNEFLNKRWHEYTGRSPEESHGWGWQATFHPEDLPPLMEKWRELLVSGEPGEIEARLRRHDGVYRWFLIRVEPFRDASGKLVRWYGTSTDIEDRKQAEEKLRQDQRELRQLIDFLPQHVLVLDADGTLVQANQTTLDYSGRTLDEMTNAGTQERITRDLHPDDVDRVANERRNGISKGVAFEIEKRMLGRDGQFRWFLFRYKPVLNEDGRIVRWFATATDIDERKRAEDRMRNEAVALREDIVRSSMFEEIVGSSEAMREILAQISRVAPTDSTVLIQGETGTGKELIARAIHNRSKRANRAFIRVNCAAIPPSLIASELFGHEKGAFTGALQRRLGRFELADGGTIFLDEVGELPHETQISLLRVLQEREFERVGGNQSIHVDVRVLAATNRDLNAAVDEGGFRKDLFYRLNVFPIDVPLLRDRSDDIPLLVEYLVDRYAKKAGKRIRSISKQTLQLFQSYSWPGNVRELQNVIERAVIVCDSETFRVDASWFARTAPISKAGRPFAADLAAREKAMIENALSETKGVISGPAGAAAKLGLPRQTLESKIRKLRINRHRFKV
jgi:formate hydrogenlyase transcriptional activator